jgi:DNA-binding MarR family transcriptional regulator
MQPDFKLPCTAYRLRMASRRATRLYDRHLAPSGLGIAQFGLLQIIAMRGGAKVTDVAGALDMDRTTLTRNLTPLVREGLVRLGAGPDKRSRAITITDAGKARLADAFPLWRQAQAAVRASMGEAEIGQLHALLDAAVQRLPES